MLNLFGHSPGKTGDCPFFMFIYTWGKAPLPEGRIKLDS